MTKNTTKKSNVIQKKSNQKFKEQYFDFYDDIKHQSKNKDIEW